MWIRANLVLGAQGQSTYQGSSKGLSSRFDRARFHQIRGESQVILIGGQTARHEPYAKTPMPLVILSGSGDIPTAVRANPDVRIWNCSPSEAIAQLRAEGLTKILVEAGGLILQQLSEANLLDGLYLTQTNSDIGEKRIDVEQLTCHMELVSVEDSDGESFFFYSR